MNKREEGAMNQWNSNADEFNQWDNLGQDEKDELIDEFNEEHDFRAHIVCEDPRYPYLCINGTFNYGLNFDPETGEIGRTRFCICGGRDDFECICNL